MFLTLENPKVDDIYGYTEGSFTINLSLIRHIEWRKAAKTHYGTIFFDNEHRVLTVGKGNCDLLQELMANYSAPVSLIKGSTVNVWSDN